MLMIKDTVVNLRTIVTANLLNVAYRRHRHFCCTLITIRMDVAKIDNGTKAILFPQLNRCGNRKLRQSKELS